MSTFEWMAEHDNLLIAKIYFKFWNFIGSIGFWRKRATCWLIGCDEHRGRSGYLPDDCTEWWCDRCGAEGINHQVFTRDTLYGFIPTMKDRISSCPHRIKQKLCRHRDISWRLIGEHWGIPIKKPYQLGYCKRCHKSFVEYLETDERD